MKIVNFRKFKRSLVIVCMISILLSVILVKGSLSHKEVEYKSLYVSNGDTLWQIAENLKTENGYYMNKDTRYIISDIKYINNMESSNIYEGQELRVPII